MRWHSWQRQCRRRSLELWERSDTAGKGALSSTEGWLRKCSPSQGKHESSHPKMSRPSILLITVSLEAKNYILIVKASLSQHSPTFYMESSQQLINKQKCTVCKSVKRFWVCIKAYHKIDSDYVWEHTAALRRHSQGDELKASLGYTECLKLV